jgi:hypothetical protein
MPELPVKEVRLSELHLPEIDRDEIVRSLSELRLPTVEIPKVERPRIDLPEGFGRFDWRSIDVTGALAGAAAITRLGRPVIRRRWTVVAGAVIVAGLAAAAVLANPAVRERAGRAVRDLRTRVDSRIGSDEILEIEEDLPVADASDPDPFEAVSQADEPVDLDVAMADAEEAGSRV